MTFVRMAVLQMVYGAAVDIAWISLGADACGEPALAYIPRRPSTAVECMIVAAHTERADAWTGTSLRTAIEYHGRLRQRRVVLGLPRQRRAATLLAGLLDNDLPRHFCLTNDSGPVGLPPRNVILPSTVVWNVDEGDNAGDAVLDFGEGYPRRPVRYIAGATSMLAEQTFQRQSPIGTICTVVHERDDNTLQLVMTDLGLSERAAPASGQELEALVQRSEMYDTVGWLATQAERLELEVDITVAAGAGRLRTTEMGPIGATTEAAVAGFTTAVVVGL